MMLHAVDGLEPVPSHRRWLHDLRNAVSTAGVAASVGRRLVRDDAAAAADMLAEAERALVRCRELLAAAADHVRDEETSMSAAVDEAATTAPLARRREGDASDAG